MKKNNLVDVVTLGFLSVTVFSGDSDKEQIKTRSDPWREDTLSILLLHVILYTNKMVYNKKVNRTYAT